MKNKLPLLLILMIGVLTPVASTLLFFFAPPTEQTNIGTVLPAEPLDATGWQTLAGEPVDPAQWRGNWVLAFGGGGACDEACQRRLCQMRQLRLMLPGNYLRLQRVWLVTDNVKPPAVLQQATDCGEVEIEGVQAAEKDTLDGVEILRLPAGVALPAGANDLYLIDPAAIWAMAFSPDLSTYQIRSDVKRLLKISKGRKQLQ